jgi:colanic acid/amylovoran biosynthesis glycosyltransferase
MSEPLRIAIFVNAFPVTSETFILRQVCGLLDLGHEVHIFANTRGEMSPLHECITTHRLLERTSWVEGPPASLVWEMPVRPVSGETWLPGAEKAVRNLDRIAAAFPVLQQCATSRPDLTRLILNVHEYGYRARSWSGAYRLAALLNHTGFDVLHAHFGPVASSFCFARELFEAPLVVSFHGYDFTTIPRKEGADTYSRLWPAADRVLANSDYTQQRLLALGCPASKLNVLPVGLDPSAYPFREKRTEANPVKLLTVARLVEIKGHEYVLRALASLKREVNFRYDIVGDGPLRSKLAALARELGINDFVYFHGSQTEASVRDFFSQAHLFVLTSVNVSGDAEGQGLVLQEAQAAGLPVIATRHGAFPEGIAPANAHFLVPERDVAALAQTLRGAIANHAEWPSIGRAGRVFVEQRYNIQRLNCELIDVYREARERFRLLS